MRFVRADPGPARLATLDVETTAADPSAGELVAVGVGVHDRGEPASAADYAVLLRDGRGELALVERALDWLDDAGADLLVTYNGRAFDVPFLRGRVAALTGDRTLPPLLTDPAHHRDLFAPRRERATRTGAPWPSLEDCLDAYEFPVPATELDGRPITNRRFGEVVGPAVLAAVRDGGGPGPGLRGAVEHYLRTDLAANLAVYHGDVGAAFEAGVLGADRAFQSGDGVLE